MNVADGIVAAPGRAVRHHLTEEGARLRAEGQALADGIVESSFGGLSPAQLDQLGVLLQIALGSGED